MKALKPTTSEEIDYIIHDYQEEANKLRRDADVILNKIATIDVFISEIQFIQNRIDSE